MSEIKVALVTGAARGIGLATTKQLVGEGWHVFRGWISILIKKLVVLDLKTGNRFQTGFLRSQNSAFID